MSDLTELLTGSTLILASFAVLIALLPRKGHAVAWVRKPFVGPVMSVLIVSGLAIGVIFVASYFTTIDDIKLLG